jgi:hypothetical protein
VWLFGGYENIKASQYQTGFSFFDTE